MGLNQDRKYENVSEGAGSCSSDISEKQGNRQDFEDELCDVSYLDSISDFSGMSSDRLKEAAVAYGSHKSQGEFTLEDYYMLPEDVRAELIDGVIYYMAAPAFGHQSIAARLTSVFLQYIDRKNGRCEAVAAPVDVQLDRDDKTMVQPDVLILCDPDKLKNGVVYGAPDLVVEILSPSTKRKDRTLKLRKYREAGVREYWIIDPERREVEVYLFQDPELLTLPKVYSFDDRIPVGIYGGDCQVDFGEIARRAWGV